ncbi:MAG: PilZ domain-containing protein [Planctomycetes bacterium]|nr:PilZ domain-containing protein [Planctomycetota bacterium]
MSPPPPPPREELRSARDERRRFDRLRIDLETRLRVLGPDGQGQGEAIGGVIKNLGPEGAFLLVSPPGTVEAAPDRALALEMCFELGDGRDPVRALAEVRWERQTEGGRGLGVQFTRLSDFEKQAIYYFCLRKYAEARGLI